MYYSLYFCKIHKSPNIMIEANNKVPNVDDSLKWHFFNLYCMALSDTDFDPREAELLYKIGLEHGLNKSVIDEIVVTSGLRPVIPQTLEEKVSYLYDLARMAWADGVIEDEERIVLKKYVLRFGFEVNNADGIVDYLLDSVENGKTLEQLYNEIKS